VAHFEEFGCAQFQLPEVLGGRLRNFYAGGNAYFRAAASFVAWSPPKKLFVGRMTTTLKALGGMPVAMSSLCQSVWTGKT